MIVNDRRSDEQKKATLGFIVATDKFMSGWGDASDGASYFAVPYDSYESADIIEQNMRNRSEMLRVRTVGRDFATRTLPYCAHLSICALDAGQPMATRGAF